MEMIKKYKWPIVLALFVSTGVLSFFYRFYHSDMKALAGFSASYKKFNQTISDFSIWKTDELENKAGDALTELNTKASLRLSSLIKNDAELMDLALEVANLSGKEMENLRVHKRASQSQNADLDRLAGEYGTLTLKRKAAYARFQQLAGFKD
jgi:hypothetical protein